jgi:Predicted membrane protein
MRIFSYLILLVIMLVGLTFASLNSQLITFNYYLGTYEITLSLLLVFAFGVGIFVGLLFAVASWLKAKYENVRLKNKFKVLEKEVENLRSLPLKED